MKCFDLYCSKQTSIILDMEELDWCNIPLLFYDLHANMDSEINRNLADAAMIAKKSGRDD